MPLHSVAYSAAGVMENAELENDGPSRRAGKIAPGEKLSCRDGFSLALSCRSVIRAI